MPVCKQVQRGSGQQRQAKEPLEVAEAGGVVPRRNLRGSAAQRGHATKAVVERPTVLLEGASQRVGLVLRPDARQSDVQLLIHFGFAGDRRLVEIVEVGSSSAE